MPVIWKPIMHHKKTFRIDWARSQGGSIVSEDGHDEVEDPGHPLHDTWATICEKSKRPAEYTTLETLAWINDGINLFGFDAFKAMVRALDAVKVEKVP